MVAQFSFIGGNSTKEKIVEVLSKDWPLTARKIYSQLSQLYHLGITYQATHKALQELITGGVLNKNSEGYQINKEWVNNLGNFSEHTRQRLEENGKTNVLKTHEKFSFPKHSDFVKFHIGFMADILRKEGKINMTFYFRHVPYPNILSADDIGRLRPMMKKIKWNIVAKYSTPLDKWCARYWRKIGVDVSFSNDIPTSTMLIVLNDYVIDVKFSHKGIKEWDKIFSISKLGNTDMGKMTETMLNKKYKTIATIIKDKELASFIKSK